MQMAARYNLALAPETAALCQSIADTFGELPIERVWGEWDKWATQSVHLSRGLAVLVETGWLRHFPEIASMRGTPQEPEWHPEGDVLTHTQYCLDALAESETWKSAGPPRRRLLSFAVLAHDFGKPLTTTYADKHGVMRWISSGHEAAGGPLAETFLQRIGAPHDLIEPVRALVVHHLLHHQGSRSVYTDTQIRRLARRLMPATIEDLCEVMSADAHGRPPLSPRESLALIAVLRTRSQELFCSGDGTPSDPARPAPLGARPDAGPAVQTDSRYRLRSATRGRVRRRGRGARLAAKPLRSRFCRARPTRVTPSHL